MDAELNERIRFHKRTLSKKEAGRGYSPTQSTTSLAATEIAVNEGADNSCRINARLRGRVLKNEKTLGKIPIRSKNNTRKNDLEESRG